MPAIVTPGGVAMAALALAGKTLEQMVKQGRLTEIERLEIIQATADHLQRTGTPEAQSGLAVLTALYLGPQR
jgi:hypothetical protein